MTAGARPCSARAALARADIARLIGACEHLRTPPCTHQPPPSSERGVEGLVGLVSALAAYWAPTVEALLGGDGAVGEEEGGMQRRSAAQWAMAPVHARVVLSIEAAGLLPSLERLLLQSLLAAAEGSQVCTREQLGAFWRSSAVLLLDLHLEGTMLSVATAHFSRALARLLAERAAMCSLPEALEALVVPIEARLWACIGEGTIIRRWVGLLEGALGRVYVHVLAGMAFDGVLEYPESRALLDRIAGACQCVPSLPCAGKGASPLAILQERLVGALSSRLLNGAFATEDIVLQLALSLAPLWRLDPTGFLLDRTMSRAAKYILSRHDGQRAIIAVICQLAADDEGLLDGETAARQFQSLPEIVFDSQEALCSTGFHADWLPDPVEAGDEHVRPSAKGGGNVFTLLANLFASPDDFVEAYALHLAARLLGPAPAGSTMSAQVTELELFKARLPYANWSRCEVMLRDCAQAPRIEAAPLVGRAIVRSHLYWPASKEASPAGAKEDEERCEGLGGAWPLPACEQMGRLEQSLEKIKESYERVHEGRRLVWDALETRLTLAVTFPCGAGQPVDFECGEREARILLRLSSGPATIADLVGAFSPAFAAAPEGAEAAVCRAIDYWLVRRVLVVAALEEGDEGEAAARYGVMLADAYDEEAPGLLDASISAPLGRPSSSAALSVASASDDEYASVWSYVVAMLTNLGELRGERIQSMLGMFAADYRGSLERLAAFLDAKAKGGVLLKGATGAYSLAP